MNQFTMDVWAIVPGTETTMTPLTITLYRGPDDTDPLTLYSFNALRDMLSRMGLCVFSVIRRGRTLTLCGC